MTIKSSAKDFPVVCVGGSAGGLDAYIRLLRQLPPDMGVAIVIVNHLRIVETRLHEILPAITEMPVELITEGLDIRPNRVFIIPAQRDLHVITSTPMAQASMDWAIGWRDQWSDELFLEFVWSQPLRYALQARDWDAAKSILREAGQPWPPSWSALVMAASGALGRHRSLALMGVLDSLRGHRS